MFNKVAAALAKWIHPIQTGTSGLSSSSTPAHPEKKKKEPEKKPEKKQEQEQKPKLRLVPKPEPQKPQAEALAEPISVAPNPSPSPPSESTTEVASPLTRLLTFLQNQPLRLGQKTGATRYKAEGKGQKSDKKKIRGIMLDKKAE